jgi:hypothetical protein
VEQLKKDRLEKAMAKDRWKRWQSTQKYKRAGAWDQDYQRWDKYIDSDEEEDELPPVPPPETAEFKAMEADINERAADKEKRRKLSNGEIRFHLSPCISSPSSPCLFSLASLSLSLASLSLSLLCSLISPSLLPLDMTMRNTHKRINASILFFLLFPVNALTTSDTRSPLRLQRQGK